MNRLYLLGRMLSVGVKPAIIYIISAFSTTHNSILFAKVYLIVPIIMLLLSNDSHRPFYKFFFSDNKTVGARCFNEYMFSLLILCLIGISAISFYYTFIEVSSINLILPVSFFFLSEKIGDEVLRFNLFEKQFSVWGILVIKRMFIQIAALSFFFLTTQSPILFFIFVGIGNIVVFNRYYYFFKKTNLLHVKRQIRIYSYNSIKLIFNNWTVWLFAILSALVVYIDRIIIMFSNVTMLPFFTIVVFCMSIIQMGVDYFYITTYRKEFLKGQMHLKTILKSQKFIKTLSSSIVIAYLLVFFSYFTYSDNKQISFVIIILISINQIAAALTALAKEIVYWSSYLNKALILDIFFWGLLMASLLVCKHYLLKVEFLLMTASFFTILRFSGYAYLANLVSKNRNTQNKLQFNL